MNWKEKMEATDKAKALLDIARQTYADEIAPGLPKEKRYVGAMVASALGVAQRRLEHADPAVQLLENLEASDMKDLAKSIRSGQISDETHERLPTELMNYIEAELAITNPKFLQRRKGG